MKRIDPLGLLILLITAITALTMLFTVGAYSEGNVGFNYNRALADSSWGINADYETEVRENVNFGIEGQLQSGNAYLGNLDLSVTLFKNLRLESNNVLKGYEIRKLGRTNDLGLSFVIPINSTEWSVGVFGNNGSPFPEVYELKDTSDPTSAELVDSGISIKDGSSLNVAVRGELDVSRFEIDARAIFEVAGQGEKAHQLNLGVETGGQLIGGIGWSINGKIKTQLYSGVIEYEHALISSIQYDF